VFSNLITPARTTVLDDLTPVTVAGLAVKTAVVMGPPYEEGDGTVKISGAITPFVATTVTGLPLTLYGYYVLDTDGGELLGCALFDTPVICTQIGDGVSFTPVLPYGS